MTTAYDIVKGALQNINSYTSGEVIASNDFSDALDVLNDLLDSFSTDELAIYGSVETILTFTPGQYEYTIGHATGGTTTGILTSGSNVITSITPPSALIVNALVTDSYGAIPANTFVTAIGATTVTLSKNATLTPGAAVTITYTIPGNFYKDASTGVAVERPLRITNWFTRLTTSGSSLDYVGEIITQTAYTNIGFKGIAMPWPTQLFYNPTVPLGTLYFYGNPSQAGQLHLFTDVILTNLSTSTTVVTLPQGYSRWLKWSLAKELAPMYGAEWTQTHESRWKEARTAVMALNALPPAKATFDLTIRGGPKNDAGFILHGGFRGG